MKIIANVQAGRISVCNFSQNGREEEKFSTLKLFTNITEVMSLTFRFTLHFRCKKTIYHQQNMTYSNDINC